MESMSDTLAISEHTAMPEARFRTATLSDSRNDRIAIAVPSNSSQPRVGSTKKACWGLKNSVHATHRQKEMIVARTMTMNALRNVSAQRATQKAKQEKKMSELFFDA